MYKIILTLIVFILTQGTDRWLVSLLGSSTEIDLFICQLDLVWNQGVAFGWLSQHSRLQELYLLATISLLCGWVITKLYYLQSQEKNLILGWSLILGGGLSNLVHRATLGAIPDLVVCSKLPFSLGGLYFNASDLALVIGCGLVIIFVSKKQYN